MTAILVRNGDYYVDHRERMEIARRKKADLFVSIHADAVDDRRARGASVYVLSLKGASDEASRRLAQRENAADLVGGVSLAGKDPVLASVLLDLSQNAALSASLDVGASASLGLAYDWLEATTSGARDAHEIVPYATFQLDERWSLGPYAVFGLSDGSPNHGFGISVSVRP